MEATDAFFQDWRNLRVYAHPLWCLTPSEGTLLESDIGSGNPVLADTAMVTPADENAGGLSPRPPRPNPIPGGHAFPQLQLHSINTPTSVGGMEGLRGQLRAEAISEGAINLTHLMER